MRHTHLHAKESLKNIKAEAIMSTQRICKVEKSSATTLSDKELTKVMWVCLVLVIYCWPWPWPEEGFSLSSFSHAICVSRVTRSQGLGLIALFAGLRLQAVYCHHCHSIFWVLTLALVGLSVIGGHSFSETMQWTCSWFDLAHHSELWKFPAGTQ